MHKKYELWLDESGDFKNQNELRNIPYRRPSLVGGILISASDAKEIEFDKILYKKCNHCTEMNKNDKTLYVLPILELIKNKYKAELVYFENTEYEDEATNRQLYLRMISEGLLQLMLTLNASSESVDLTVVIASRQDIDASLEYRQIKDQEYINYINKCIRSKKKDHKIILNEDSSVNFIIDSANSNPKLQLADFACNTRLTRDSSAFLCIDCDGTPYKFRVNNLFNDMFIFKLSEVTSENYIKNCLSAGAISDAIYELYTTTDKINRKSSLDLIISKMKTSGYRLVKSELKTCSTRLTAYVSQENDYEIGCTILKKIIKELIPQLQKADITNSNFLFNVLLQLSDMQLREGDVISARKTIEYLEKVQRCFGNNLEEIMSYYQLIEKQAVLYIDEFNYESAVNIMEKSCKTFKNIILFVENDEYLRQRFSSVKSEYYGDSLCMLIYAKMFLQRGNTEIYNQICKLSDIAMQQYPKIHGELERHIQYRSHIEMEQGNFQKSLKWLLKTKLSDINILSEIEIKESQISDFLTLLYQSENLLSCTYYLMYYIELMSEAKRSKSDIGDRMYSVLCSHDNLTMQIGINNLSYEKPGANLVLDEIKQKDSGVDYHPLEIIYWKYASFLHLDGKNYCAKVFYDKAIDICYCNDKFITMQITGIGIYAEAILCAIKRNDRYKAKELHSETIRRIDNLLNNSLTQETRNFVLQLKEMLMKNKLDEQSLIDTSRKITY